jgi:hypothetical protein
MLTAARRKDFAVIVAEDSSRLWRNPAEQSPRMAELSDLCIEVVCGDLDTRDESAGIMSGVKGVMNSEYRKEIGKRTRRALEGLALAGKPTGGKTFGYERDGDRMVVNKAQAKIVVRIFTAYRDGHSPRRIASDLNRDGVPSPGASWKRTKRRRDGSWLFTGVRTILRNPKYTGAVAWGNMRWKRLATDSSRRLRLPGIEEPINNRRDDLRIIDAALWTAVQKRIEATAKASGQRGVSGAIKHPLSGLLKCSRCSASYAVCDSYNYACASHRDGGPHACNNALRVPRATVERAVFDSLGVELLRPEWLVEFSRWFRVQVDAGLKAKGANSEKDAKRRAEVERELKNMVDAIKHGGLSGSRTMATELRALEEEQAALAVVAPVRSNVVPLFTPARLKERFGALVKDLPAVAKADPARARQLLRSLVGDAIRVCRGRTVGGWSLR